jgi:serine O-acetyltransferase
VVPPKRCYLCLNQRALFLPMSPTILLYRVGNCLFNYGVPILPRLFSVVNRVVFSCQLPCSARLGAGVELGYWGLGIVVHSRAVIGARTLIRQNVTIGTRHKGGDVPEIGSDVVIGAGAVLVGGIKVGDGAVIGANSVVNRDVPSGAVVVGVPARVIRVAQ